MQDLLGAGSEEKAPNVSAARATPERLDRILDALTEAGSAALLLGESGTGKTALAEEAAYALGPRLEEDLAVFIVPEPAGPRSGVNTVFGFQFPEIFGADVSLPAEEYIPDPATIARRLIDAISSRSEGRSAVVVVLGADRLPPASVYVLADLMREPRIRIIATAQHLVGGAERMMRDPAVSKISSGPLDRIESGRFVAELLRVERIDSATLQRWYSMTDGNPYALSLLALACDRQGVVQRERGVAWVPESDQVPPEIASFVSGVCGPDELRTLETIALAEPMHETALLRSLDAMCAAALHEHGLIRSRTRSDGSVALVLGHPLLRAAVIAGIPPLRRLEIYDELFGRLAQEVANSSAQADPAILGRLVFFGFETGRTLPLSWLWTTLTMLMRGSDPRVVLRVALAVAAHGDAAAEQAGVAALRAARTARLLGDSEAQARVAEIIGDLLADEGRRLAMGPSLRISLQLTGINQRMVQGAPLESLLGELDGLERGLTDAAPVVIGMVHSARALLLASAGRLREANGLCCELELSSDLALEWVRSPARVVSALILQQQGRFSESIRLAEVARRLSLLGERPRFDSADLHGLSWYLGYWTSGSSEAGRQVLAELEETASADLYADTHYSGIVEVGLLLSSVREGNWRAAAQTAERLLERLALRGHYEFEPLVQAAYAFALAALGERAGARRALSAAETPFRGISQIVGGVLRVLTLRTRQWLRDDAVIDLGLKTAEWARDQGLSLIELEALHIVAAERGEVRQEERERARALAAVVEAPLGEALRTHIERIADPALGRDDGPEVRLLAEFGIWVPLPEAPGLSAREREVALFAGLGYSSRSIADRFHLSIRTVETHLAHVFTKIGVQNRDGLRTWFHEERSVS